jgi:hypothetical protein
LYMWLAEFKVMSVRSLVGYGGLLLASFYALDRHATM